MNIRTFEHSDIESLPFFFIIGRARSGTTMLRMFFDAHPEVCIPIESPVILHLYQKYGKQKEWTTGNLTGFYNDLLKIKDFEKWEIDRENLKSGLLGFNGRLSFQSLIKYIYLNYQSIFLKTDIKLIGDKNPVYSVNINEIFKIFPEAKYIHLTRDYRDHILSMVKTGLLTPVVLFLAYRWKLSAKSLLRMKRKHPGSFYTIRYEDVVSDPGRYIKEMCSFLCIRYVPQVLEYAQTSESKYREQIEAKLEAHHKKVFEPVSTDRINVWKSEMNDKDVRTADLIVGKYAELSGYTRKYNRFDLLLYLKLLPAIIREHLSYSLKVVTGWIPYKVKMQIRKYLPAIAYAISKAGK